MEAWWGRGSSWRSGGGGVAHGGLVGEGQLMEAWWGRDSS